VLGSRWQPRIVFQRLSIHPPAPIRMRELRFREGVQGSGEEAKSALQCRGARMPDWILKASET
jgi:hypothetical protein